MDGVLNILKPPGMTSHDVVGFVRRTLGTKRVGHTGTLDPAAAGVLPVCVGQATRLVEYLQNGTKEYIAEATFGYETDTCDAVGEVISRGDATHITLDSLRPLLDDFRGDISQTPPMHSAIKVDGKKLYELARAGNTEIEIPTRQVSIHRLFASLFLPGNPPRAMLKVNCGTGTYIRSLIRDIGRVAGCGATMTFLVRTRSGNCTIEQALTLEEIAIQGKQALVPPHEALNGIFSQIENDDAVNRLARGQIANLEEALQKDFLSGDRPFRPARLAIWNREKTTVAIAKQLQSEEPGDYKPEKVLFLQS